LLQILKNNDVLVIIIAASIFSISYLLHPARPDLGITFLEMPYNWEHWYDQRTYTIIATKIVDGTLNIPEPTSGVGYISGLGYPVLSIFSVIFSSKDSVLFHHGFFVPNLLLFVGVVYMTFDLMKKLTKNLWVSILGISAFLFLSPYLIWFVEPWNGHVVEFAIIGIVFLLIRQKDTVPKKINNACMSFSWLDFCN